jgi:hypothetical protein
MRRSGEVEIEVTGFTYGSGESTDFGIIIASNDGGAVLGGDLEPSDGHRDSGRHTGRITDESDLEYINGVRDGYMEMVADQGYEMIFDEIELVEEETPFPIRITLGRGDYRIYAEGGQRIADLDLRVYDEDGEMVAEDNVSDNMPICEISTGHSQTFEIEVYAYEMNPSFTEGYFVIVVVRE